MNAAMDQNHALPCRRDALRVYAIGIVGGIVLGLMMLFLIRPIARFLLDLMDLLLATQP